MLLGGPRFTSQEQFENCLFVRGQLKNCAENYFAEYRRSGGWHRIDSAYWGAYMRWKRGGITCGFSYRVNGQPEGDLELFVTRCFYRAIGWLYCCISRAEDLSFTRLPQQ